MSFIINPYRFAVAGGGDSGPELISDLALWLNANAITGKSDGDQLTTWEDDSGNNRDATGQEGGLNTIKPRYRATAGPNSKPAVQISDEATPTSGYFTLADNSFSGLTEGHIFCVVKIDQDPPDANAEAGPPTSFGTSGDDYFPFPADSKIYDGFASSARKTTVNPTPALTSWRVYEARSESGAWSNYLDGVLLHGPVANTVAFRSTLLRIGSAPTGLKTLNGHIAEIILYGRVLDSGEITDVYDYLETKYGITLP